MKKPSRELPWAAAGGSIAVGAGLLAMGVLIASAGRSEPGVLPSSGASLAQVERLAGGKPERCVYAGPGRELCRWQIEGRLMDPRGADTRSGALVLVCEISADGAELEDGSCFVGAPAAAEDTLPPVSAPSHPAERIRLAAEALEASRDVTSLSRLVGDVPDSCQTLWGGQLCRWSLDPGRPGGERLAALAEGDADKELRCTLPLDAERADHSCTVATTK